MADKTNPSLAGMSSNGDAVKGRVQLAPEVLEVIIGIATNEVEGVATTKGNFATGVAEKFGKVFHGKGVKTDWVEDKLIVDVYCVVQYGYSIPTVATEIQKQIRHTVFNMTSLETKEVNVHVTGIDFDVTDDNE
ncbi:Asp23/Gls24 family envelope stress response protein [Sporosarcina highlanderae]|uniref:Asp23/Gls24 family envelope stress response protein n=1 Tax=Sporosarcina highlanderae TaxID=3035916 RepID=A0ABT8JRZ0_9BACL|nr:Asp23/Gls24 family envelope stress response protein [Sporosarcina highlanderae]MDN4607782.1 Asp23/Gls24 family envelope stress response protein [Sporosarcina highlanderae]